MRGTGNEDAPDDGDFKAAMDLMHRWLIAHVRDEPDDPEVLARAAALVDKYSPVLHPVTGVELPKFSDYDWSAM